MLEHIADQAEVNRRMRPWGDVDYRRFAFRVSLLKRRGLTDDAAEFLADRLALRDQQGDDRRVCLECADMQRSGHCFAAKQGRLSVACDPDRFLVVPALLQRCQQFTWAKPA